MPDGVVHNVPVYYLLSQCQVELILIDRFPWSWEYVFITMKQINVVTDDRYLPGKYATPSQCPRNSLVVLLPYSLADIIPTGLPTQIIRELISPHVNHMATLLLPRLDLLL